ncbi:MAG TPA: low-specificity L-threonine aldolase, partial [Burkholderiaceae bacterium]|nr:low-specificity L-threonine aldolase [Burkholderiaceae bacterium]
MIDLRSDTVTRPSAGMRRAMFDAEVGDDVFGDDPTVNRLQATLAERLGYEAGLFFASGTQSNLAALMAHCQRGDEYIVGQEAHTYRYEGGGAAVLGSIQPQPLANQADGSIALADIEAAIKPDDVHYARTRLIALENTIGGKVLSPAYVAAVAQLAQQRGLAMHLDGARLFNAAVKLDLDPRAICADFDSVSVCLSKGLGAPVGSVLCGSHELIKHATRWRKMLGGGMRQSGVLAATGLYALEHHVERLVEDHRNAATLAEGLSDIGALRLEPVQTNIVYVHVAQKDCAALQSYLAEKGICALIGAKTRLVTHLDVSE